MPGFSNTRMQTHTRRAIRAALLSLFIAASFLTTGGWFCADGRACLPALSPTCCCGGAAGDASAPAVEGGADLCADADCESRLTEGGCGCYRGLPAIASQLAGPHAPTALPAALSAGSALTFVRPDPCLVSPTAPNPTPPPRYLVSPRDTRAPPVA